MKNIVLAALLCTWLHKGTVAQFIKAGPKLGANLVKIDGQAFKEGYQLGYFAGIFAEFKLSESWYLQTDVLFNETRFDQSTDFRDVYRNLLRVDSLTKIKLQGLSIPKTANWKPANFLSFSAGFQVSAFMQRGAGILQNAANTFKQGDLALVGGANLLLGKFRVNGRYSFGLFNLNNIEGQNPWRQQVAQLGVGWVL